MATALAALALPGLLLPPSPAEACSCVAMSAAVYFAGADLVFLARAGKVVRKGASEETPLAVLLALKGAPGAVFTLRRTADTMSPCQRDFAENEVSVVFVVGGLVTLCEGNFGLAAQAPHLRDYLELGTAKPGLPALTAMLPMLEAGLTGYLHDRPVVDVAHAPLAGTTVKVGTSKLRFVKATGKSGVKLTAALSSGPIHYVSGFYGREGLSFAVLLHETTPPDAMTPSYVVLGAWRSEK